LGLWLFKEEPSHYSFEQLQLDGETLWDGVRNSQAIKYLKNVRTGDKVLYYHTGDEKCIVGVAVVSDFKEGKYPSVRIKPEMPLKRPVSLYEIKGSHRFDNHPLVRQPRLSVMPVTQELWDFIMELARH
jgi:predicted RNA-binding protein with PUA-like domain